MASTPAPYAPSRTGRVLAGHAAGERHVAPLVVLVVATAFVVSAIVFIAPQVAGTVRSLSLGAPGVPGAGRPAREHAAPAILSRAGVEHVLSYAQGMRSDDSLVEVRPGVYAKKSNVHGVAVGDSIVYYDLAAHQSFGPLRRGELAESQVTIHAREPGEGFLVLVYSRK